MKTLAFVGSVLLCAGFATVARGSSAMYLSNYSVAKYSYAGVNMFSGAYSVSSGLVIHGPDYIEKGPNPYIPISALTEAEIQIQWSADVANPSWQMGPVNLPPNQQPHLQAVLKVNGQAPNTETSNRLEVRWFWEDTPLDIGAKVVPSGSLWGNYRVELWDKGVGHGEWSSLSTTDEFPGSWQWVSTPALLASVSGHIDLPPDQPAPASQTPVFVDTPGWEVVVVPQGASSVDLKVRAAASEPFQYTWFRQDGSVIKTSQPGNWLTVSSNSVTWDGRLFYCTASNAHGSASSGYRLVRLAHPPQASGNFSGIRRVGDDFSHAFLISSDTPVSYLWTGPAGDRITTGPDGQMSISNLRLSDGGKYTLVATNAEGKSSCTFTLGVVDYEARGHPLLPGLTLNVRSNPAASVLGWWHDSSGSLFEDKTGSFALPVDRQQAELRFKSVKPALAGAYLCTLQIAGSIIDCNFEVESVAHPAALPAITLPDGTIGIPYESAGFSIPQDYLATASSYSVVGALPKGLRLNSATGQISGRPLVSGDFIVAFRGANAKGKSAPLLVPLHIAALPADVPGTYLLWGTDLSSLRVDMVVGPNGSFSGKLQGIPFTGWLQSTPAGRSAEAVFDRITSAKLFTPGFNANGADYGTFSPYLKVVLPGHEGRVTGNLNLRVYQKPSLTLQGWRKGPPATTKADPSQTQRYTFAEVRSLPSLAEQHWMEQGVVHGTCTVTSTGVTTAVTHSPVSTTTAFVGPQGEVLALRLQPGQCAELRISADGSIASAQSVSAAPCYKASPSSAAVQSTLSQGLQSVTTQFLGRCYVPAAAGQLLINLSPGTQPGTGLLSLAASASGCLDQAFPWVLNSKDVASLSLAKTAAELQEIKPVSLTFNRATGEYSGKLLLNDFLLPAKKTVWQDATLPFHGVIIQAQDGTFDAPGSCKCRIMTATGTPQVSKWNLDSFLVELR